MGYKAELHRGFSEFMNFSFCFTAVSVISGCSLLFPYGLVTGGPVVMVWGWVIGSIFSTIVGTAMAEICSSYPSAGSVYHWAGMLANKEWAPFASYICGWFNFVGNAAGDASFAFGFAQVLTACIALGSDGEDKWGVKSQVVISIIVSLIWALKNLMRVDHQGWFNNASAVYQIASTIIIIVCILWASPVLSTNNFVWSHYNNDTGMPNAVYVSCIGLLMCLFSFSGYEGGAHMAEETRNAAASAPRGIVLTCIATALTGLVYILGLLYACQNKITEFFNGESDYPVVNVYIQAFTNSDGHHWKIGSIIITILLLVNLFCAGFSSMTVTSRIGFAMARDKAFPFSHVLHRVNSKTKAPDTVIALVFFLDVLLCLLPLISKTAFEAITSIAAIGYQISYAIPILLKLTVSKRTFIKSAFNLGKYSDAVGWTAVVWLVVTSCFFVLPLKFDENMNQTFEDFNWTGVVLAIVLLIAMIYWYLPAPLGAKHFFKGPKRQDDDNLIEVEEVDPGW